MAAGDIQEFCSAAWARLGFSGQAAPVSFPSEGLSVCHRATIVRQAEAGTFRWEERWVLAGLDASEPLDAVRRQAVRNAVAASRATDVLIVSPSAVEEPAHEALHGALASDGAALAVIAGSHARALAQGAPEGEPDKAASIFSKLRIAAFQEIEAAAWKGAYQPETLSRASDAYLPQTVKALHAEAESQDADLITAVAAGSCLLLGPPGAGKTTALVSLAAELARAGGRTGVLVRLGAYRDNLVRLIGEVLGGGAGALNEAETRALLKTGALVVLLDGLNEVQDPDAHTALVAEINALTETGSATARSRWVVTGRVRDYEASFDKPTVIEQRRWHIEPLSDDLVFRYLTQRRGHAEASRAWDQMDVGLREMCRTPLLLSLVLGIEGHVPLSRGALYRRVVEDALGSDDARGLGREHHDRIAVIWPALADRAAWRDAAMDALTSVAAAMRSTVLHWSDAVKAVAPGVARASAPESAAEHLVTELLRRGLLIGDPSGELRFRHHTFQEFFAGRRDVETPLNKLLPITWWKQGRVPPGRRESIRLLASLRADTTAIVQRVLVLGDAKLALEIAEDQPMSFARSPMIEPIARKLLKRATSDGGFAGRERAFAEGFMRCAALLRVTAESLVARVKPGTPEEIADRLARLYMHLGDAAGQRRAVASVTRGGVVPPAMRSLAAHAAREAGETERAMALWTEIAADEGTSTRDRAAALGNRARAHALAGRNEEAERDFRAAMEVDDWAGNRANLARFLHELGRMAEAEVHARKAVDLDETHAHGHFMLATVLEAGARGAPPDLAEQKRVEALTHCEAAVQLAPHAERLLTYLRSLVWLQDLLGRHEEAITSYEKLISLRPDTREVLAWKEKIRDHRRKLAEARGKRSDRDAVIADPHPKLHSLVRAWLDLANLDAHVESSICWLVRSPPQPATLVVLLLEPKLDGHQLSRATEIGRGLSAAAQRAERLLLVAAAGEPLTAEVQHKLSELRAGRTVGLLTAPEIRDTVIEGRGACRLLFTDALSNQDNPFESRGFVKVASQFWGRKAELGTLAGLLRQGQSFGLYGIHKVGKSSLLWQLRHQLRFITPDITVVRMELDASVKDAAGFFGALAYALASKETEQPSSSPPGGALPAVTSALSMRSILEQFHREKQKQFAGHRLALILDEYAYLIPDGKKARGIRGFDEVLGLLKSLVQEGWFVFVPCGRTAALTRQGNFGDVENPFLSLLPAKFLLPMPREEHHAMVSDLAREKRGIRFSDAALDRLFAESGGHPRFARDLGARLFEHRTGVIEPDGVEWAVSNAVTDADASATALQIYETRMSDVEQGVAMAAALQEGGIPYQLAFPSTATEAERIHIRDAIRNLVDTGILVDDRSSGRRMLGHRIGLLRRTLARRAEDLGLEPPQQEGPHS